MYPTMDHILMAAIVAQVKAAAQAHKAAYATESQATETEAPAAETLTTDPTIAHASLTEIEAGDAELSNGHTGQATVQATNNADVADNAANAAGESQWDAGNEASMSLSQEWVDVSVPRDPAETETGLNATPAALASSTSWADDHPEAPAEVRLFPQSIRIRREDCADEACLQQPAADPNDGFHQVQGRSRGRGDRDGGWRPRGRGEWRGRGGHRGEGRGRGRGGPRREGSGVAVRGGRRSEES